MQTLIQTINLSRRYLADPTDDVRIATEHLLSLLLKEIQDIRMSQHAHELELKAKQDAESDNTSRRADVEKEKLPDITMATSERVEFVPEYDEESLDDEARTPVDEKYDDIDSRDVGGESRRHCIEYSH